jgi:hypothetical protein
MHAPSLFLKVLNVLLMTLVIGLRHCCCKVSWPLLLLLLLAAAAAGQVVERLPC